MIDCQLAADECVRLMRIRNLCAAIDSGQHDSYCKCSELPLAVCDGGDIVDEAVVGFYSLCAAAARRTI